MTSLKYITIKCTDLEESREFYENMAGLTFKKEKHGSGPEHYAAILKDGIVFELYPAIPEDHEPLPHDNAPVFGFEIEHDVNPEFVGGAYLLDNDHNNIMLSKK